MSRAKWLFTVSMAAGGLGLGTPATAQQDSPLVALHELVRKGNKICMATHFHDGESGPQPSRKIAEMRAIQSWQGFTAWEYGGAWGSFRMAESRQVSCTGGGNSWSCSVTGRPCRRR